MQKLVLFFGSLFFVLLFSGSVPAAGGNTVPGAAVDITHIGMSHREIRVPQHRLHGTDVGAALQEMRSEAVPQGLGSDL